MSESQLFEYGFSSLIGIDLLYILLFVARVTLILTSTALRQSPDNILTVDHSYELDYLKSVKRSNWC